VRGVVKFAELVKKRNLFGKFEFGSSSDQANVMHVYHAYRQTNMSLNYSLPKKTGRTSKHKADIQSKKGYMFDRQRANSATEDGKSRSWLTGQYAIIFSL